MDELALDDPLRALLDTMSATGSDIENRVMAQLEREEAPVALRAEIAELRADVTALRAEMADIKRILLSGREAPNTHSSGDLRGKTLLPYAPRPDNALPILN